MKACMWFALGIGMAFSLMYVFAGRFAGEHLVRIFINDAPTVETGTSFVRIECIAVPFMMINNLMNTVFQAMGKGVQSLVFASCRSALLKIPATFVLEAVIGLTGIIWSQFATDVIMLGVTFGMFAGLMKKVTRERESMQ